MITLSSKTYTADAIHLSQLLSNTTKVNMLSRNKKSADVSFTQTDAFKEAMDYMDSFVADDFTIPIPVNEETKAVVAHNKYGV